MQKKINNKYVYLLVVLSYLFIGLIALHPLVVNIFTGLPDAGDSLHNIWTWGDNLNRIRDGRSIYDANIFYPIKESGTFQELQILNTLLYALIVYPTQNPIFSYNIIVLLSFVVTAFLSYEIAYISSGNKGLSFLAGFAVSFNSFRFAHLPHAQLLSFFWVLIPLLFLIKYYQKPKLKLLALFFLTYYLVIISIGYTAIFTMFFCWGYLAVNFLIKKNNSSIYVLLILIMATILAVPWYMPYIDSASRGFIRGIEESKAYGLDITLLFSTSNLNILYGEITSGLRNYRPDGSVSAVFPGFVFLALSFFAIGVILRSKNQSNEGSRDITVIYFFAMALLFFLIALGPVIKLRGQEVMISPIYLAFKYLPVFKATRYLPAYAQPALFAMSILIAIVCSRIPIFKKSKINIILLLILFLLMAMEFRSKVNVVHPVSYGNSSPPAYIWLKNNNPEYPIIELPMPQQISGSDPYWLDQITYMFYSTYHGHRIVNGNTGFFPPEYQSIMKEAGSFPNYGFIRRLHEIGVRYIVVHNKKMPRPLDDDAKLYAKLGLSIKYRDPDTTIFLIEDIKNPTQTSLTSLKPGTLEFELININAPNSVQVGSQFTIKIYVRNIGNTIWKHDTWDQTPPGRGEVRLALRSWLKVDSSGKNSLIPEDLRGRLKHDVWPNEEVEISITAMAPKVEGTYLAQLNLVDELVQWFSQPDIKISILVNNR